MQEAVSQAQLTGRVAHSWLRADLALHMASLTAASDDPISCSRPMPARMESLGCSSDHRGTVSEAYNYTRVAF